jgi:DNA (cytosine-5)-methyltransferase 1
MDAETETLIPTTGAGFDVAHSLRGEGFDASEDGTGRGTPLVPVAFSCKDHGADASDIAPTLRSMGHDGSHANGGGQVAIAFSGQMSNPQVDVNLSQTLQAKNPQAVAFDWKMGEDARGVALCEEYSPTLGAQADRYAVQHAGMAVRRLTPRECEALQGFSPNYTAIPWRNKPASECPDGPRYKSLGNSMAVPCMRWIGERIQMVEAQMQRKADAA